MIIFREEKDEDDLRDFKGAARGMAIGSVILAVFLMLIFGGRCFR